MATIIYKKFIKKNAKQQKAPGQATTCNHQRAISDASDIPLTDLHTPREMHIPRAIDKDFSSDGDDSCEICRYEKKALRKYRWKIIAGLCLPFLIQALDSTIIAGALPYIASDFRMCSLPILHLEHLPD
jgi:hypothetical protein